MSALLGARERLSRSKLSSDWKIARALLEDEYKAYLDTAFDQIRTPYEFTAHLIDVHRLWCSACRHSGGFQAVARASSHRDVGRLVSFADSAVVCESGPQQERKGTQSGASKQSSEQTIDGLQSEAPDMGLNAGLQDINEDSKINIAEMCFPLPMTSDGVDDILQADSNMETTDIPPDEIVVIKQEYHDDESSGENDNDEQRMEEAEDGWISEDSVSNLQPLADWTVVGHSSSEPSTSTLHYDEHCPEDFSQDQCNAGTDNDDVAQHTSLPQADLDLFVQDKLSSKTSKIFRTSLGILQSYCRQKKLKFRQVTRHYTRSELNDFLRTFYAEVRQTNGEHYARRSMLTLRYGLHHYFLKLRNVDIKTDHAFKGSNSIFKAVVHKLKAEGKDGSRHRSSITSDDMDKIRKSFDLSSPMDLQNKVFFDLMIHLPGCNMAREILRQMKKDDFAVDRDSAGQLYVHIVRDMASGTNTQHTGLDDVLNQRMYATGLPDCPVKSFLEYISHLNQNCIELWQRPKARRPTLPSYPWYDNTPLGINTLGNKMSVISQQAQCSKVYTNHCLRVRNGYMYIPGHLGFKSRHIISGNKSTASDEHHSIGDDSKRRKLSETAASDNLDTDSELHS